MADDPAIQDGGSGPPDPTDASGNGDAAFSDEQLSEVTGKVRESFGLKDGQRLDQMITGTVNRVVRETFGVEKDQRALDVIGNFVAKQVTEAMQPKDMGGKPDPNADLKADLDAVKKTQRELLEAKEQAEQEAYNERRGSLIRDALDAFDINPDLKGLVTRGFVQGIEANPKIAESGEGLTVADTDGAHQPFGSFLQGYFTQNKAFLTQKKFSGSGARGSGTAGPNVGTVKFSGKSGRELTKEYSEAAKVDSEAALTTLQKQNQENAARLGLPGS